MSKRNAAFLATIGGALLLGAIAETGSRPAGAATSPGQCFRASRVNGFSSVSANIVDVKVGSDQYYRLKVDGACPDASFQPRIVLRTLSGGSYICQGLDAEIVVAQAAGSERCLVRHIDPITKADWQADSHPHKK